MEHELLNEQQEMDIALYKLWRVLQEATVDLNLVLSDNAQELINNLLKELEK